MHMQIRAKFKLFFNIKVTNARQRINYKHLIIYIIKVR